MDPHNTNGEDSVIQNRDSTGAIGLCLELCHALFPEPSSPYGLAYFQYVEFWPVVNKWTRCDYHVLVFPEILHK
jgi:hypothetical protein